MNSGTQYIKFVFLRLVRFFKRRNTGVNNDTELKHLFGSNVNESEWEELKQIGLKIPSLERAIAFERISIIFCIIALIALLIFAINNLELLFVIWGLPDSRGIDFDIAKSAANPYDVVQAKAFAVSYN